MKTSTVYYPEKYTCNRPLSRDAYRTVRVVLLDYVQERREANGSELENREAARVGLVKARYAHYVLGQ